MPSYNFSPIPGSLYVQDVSDTAAGIGSGNIPSNARYAEGHVRLASLSETREARLRQRPREPNGMSRKRVYLEVVTRL